MNGKQRVFSIGGRNRFQRWASQKRKFKNINPMQICGPSGNIEKPELDPFFKK